MCQRRVLGAHLEHSGGLGEFTFHETFLDNLTQSLHVGLWQVLALLRLFQPLVGARALCQARRAWLGDVIIFSHDSASL